MKKPNITEGEWSISNSGNPDFWHCIIAEDGGSVCHITNWGEHKANAQAISAVPEMIDALVKIHSYVKENQPNYLLTSKYIQLHEIEQVLEKAGVEL